MKKIFLLFLIFSGVLRAESPVPPATSSFEEGNQYYQKENYKAAVASYESIINSGQESAEVYFNLGNAYYKLHQVSPAIYNYEKALLLFDEGKHDESAKQIQAIFKILIPNYSSKKILPNQNQSFLPASPF